MDFLAFTVRSPKEMFDATILHTQDGEKGCRSGRMALVKPRTLAKPSVLTEYANQTGDYPHPRHYARLKPLLNTTKSCGLY